MFLITLTPKTFKKTYQRKTFTMSLICFCFTFLVNRVCNPKEDVDPAPDGVYSYPPSLNDCTLFVLCGNGTAHIMSCPSSLESGKKLNFNATAGACMDGCVQ